MNKFTVVLGVAILMSNPISSQALTNEEAFKIEEYYFTGENYYDLENFEKALEFYDMALDLDPNDVDILHSKALTLYKLDRFHEALTYFDKALQYESNDTNIIYDRALTLEKIGMYLEAKKSFEKILEIRPSNTDAKEKLEHQPMNINIQLGWLKEIQSAFFIIGVFVLFFIIILAMRERFLKI